MPKLIDLTGLKFNRLLVMKKANIPGPCASWECLCDCGKITIVRSQAIKDGTTKSCGCFLREQKAKLAIELSIKNVSHGLSRTKVYGTWMSMKRRCERPWYKNKEITVCGRWESFEAFFEDMGHPPSKSHSIDRINNALGYFPENCRWATPKTQQRNKSNNNIITAFGQSKCIAEWAEISGLSWEKIKYRIKAGWSPESAVS